MNRRRSKDDDIQIKIGGWDGKFVFEKPKLKEGNFPAILITHLISIQNPLRSKKIEYSVINIFYFMHTTKDMSW